MTEIQAVDGGSESRQLAMSLDRVAQDSLRVQYNPRFLGLFLQESPTSSKPSRLSRTVDVLDMEGGGRACRVFSPHNERFEGR